MLENESANGRDVLPSQRKSMPTNESSTREIETRPRSKTPAVSVGNPFVVSNEQYEAVRTAHEDSISLLNSCGTVLLQAMKSAVPPEDSGRTVGEYTGQNLRKMAKSVCDIMQTKTGVVRSMYQISRDEA